MLSKNYWILRRQNDVHLVVRLSHMNFFIYIFWEIICVSNLLGLLNIIFLYYNFLSIFLIIFLNFDCLSILDLSKFSLFRINWYSWVSLYAKIILFSFRCSGLSRLLRNIWITTRGKLIFFIIFSNFFLIICIILLVSFV